MFLLPRSLRAWGFPEFEDVLKRELLERAPDVLPLQQGLTAGSHALSDSASVMIIGASDAGDAIRVRAGIFYAGLTAGCNCAGEASPQPEYCEIDVLIDKATAAADCRLV